MKRFDLKPGFVFSPQPMYMIGTNNADGTPNFCIITWLGFSADSGPCLMITIGGSKLTKTNILREGRFSANMITEDNLWLADYFGTTKGENGPKRDVAYTLERGRKADVPVVGESHWVYECQVKKHVPLDGADFFLAEVVNIQIDEEYRDMDMEHIELERIHPVVYSPYQYYLVKEKVGEMGEWKKHFKGVEAVKTHPEKAVGK